MGTYKNKNNIESFNKIHKRNILGGKSIRGEASIRDFRSKTTDRYRSFGFGLQILTSWTSVGFLDVGAFFCRSAMNWY
ncbi:unnamed protein product [Rhizophagus irregularis]|uniref:Uncharacterized protein n=1 Tax=Rhizophagus irregularis TaxID=588596 RepID=A0A915Z1F5_9GLOM|nr:unnamed protein product [Rhizophagus irregularis]